MFYQCFTMIPLHCYDISVSTYRVGQKIMPQYITHNFVKYWPIFKIFFHCYNLKEIFNNAIVKYPASPCVY